MNISNSNSSRATSSVRDMGWGGLLAALAAGVALFQAALAVGLPWGSAAWGGSHPGTLPVGMRVASFAAALLWAAVAAVTARLLLGAVGRRRTLLVVAVYSTVGVVMNAISPSAVERAIWVPVTMVIAVVAWLAWRESRGLPRDAARRL